jgi:hypothetical protein
VLPKKYGLTLAPLTPVVPASAASGTWTAATLKVGEVELDVVSGPFDIFKYNPTISCICGSDLWKASSAYP